MNNRLAATKVRIKEQKHQRTLRARTYVNHLKMRPCADCGVQYNPWVMQFDHRDPLIKKFELGSLKKGYSQKRINIEAEKCDVVCANCHCERTHKNKHWLIRRNETQTASIQPDNQLSLGETFTR